MANVGIPKSCSEVLAAVVMPRLVAHQGHLLILLVELGIRLEASLLEVSSRRAANPLHRGSKSVTVSPPLKGRAKSPTSTPSAYV